MADFLEISEGFRCHVWDLSGFLGVIIKNLAKSNFFWGLLMVNINNHQKPGKIQKQNGFFDHEIGDLQWDLPVGNETLLEFPSRFRCEISWG